MSAKIGTGRQAGLDAVPNGQARSGALSGQRLAVRGRFRRRAMFLACTALVATPLPAWAVTFNASDATSLQAAIAAVNSGAADTINITGNITLTGELPPITAAVIINGNGNTVSGSNQYRVFFIAAPSGAAVNISNVTLADGYAKGGNGGGGGGGGMGAGGAIFAMSGAITLTDVGFSGNRAQGGNGSSSGSSGGGGGLGGDGGLASQLFRSGGGGGIGIGATGGTDSNGGGTGILPGAGGGGASSNGGGANGGGGGGSSAGSGGGGGGVGGSGGGSSSRGGNGGFGGGGGGAGGDAAGNGGFGGGGGGGYTGSMTGGWGGFGGGGGSGVGPGGGGFGGGNGGSTGTGGGGGGMGAGGAVFVCTSAINASCGATLTISNTTNKTVDGAVVAGAGGANGSSGGAVGGAFFLTNGAVGNISVASGTTTTVSSSIFGTGDGGIALSGGGTLALTSIDNSFNGISVSGTGSTLSVAGQGSVTNTIRLGDQTRLLFAGGGSYGNTLTATGVTSLDTGGASNTVTYGGQITDGTGAGAIDVIGSGTLVLTNIANSYSGGTTVKGNTTLSIGDQRVLGSGGLTLGDATSYGRLATTGATPFVSRAITLGQGGGEIAPAAGSVLNLMGVISGSGALRQNGPGALTLSASNTYSGGTEVAGGVLLVTVNDALGSGSVTLADQTVFALENGLNIANAMKLRGTAGIRISSGTGTYSGVISDEAGPAGLRVDGGGTLILTGANSYSGGTSIVSGTLQIGAGGISGALAGDVSNNGTLVFNRLDDFGYGGVISGTGALTKSGAGILTLAGASTYTGATTVGAGTLRLDTGGRIGGGGLTVSSGATFDLNGNSQSVAGLSGQGNITLGTGALTVANATAQSFSGAISGDGSLTKAGVGTLTLRGVNTFTGGTTISAGRLEIDNGSGAASLTGNVANDGVLAFNAVSAMPVFSGNITGTGALEKNGADTLRLTGTNTYGGSTTISAGTLELSGGTSIGDLSAVSIASGAQLKLIGGSETVGSLAGAGNVVLDYRLTAGGDDTSTTFSGVISSSNTSGLTKAGTGSLTLSGANTYTGSTAVNGGRLVLSGGAALFDGTSVSVAAGAQLELLANETIGSLAGAGEVLLNANRLVAGGDNSNTLFSGVIGGSGGLSKAGTGTMTLSGANTYLGSTNIDGGTLQIGNGGTSGSILGDVVNNGVLAFKRLDDVTFAGAISGTGSLSQLGAGTLVLTGNNSYAGGTTIAASGTLQLGDGGTTGSIAGDVVNNGALAFKRQGAVTFAGAISGSGALSQLGTGTLVLTGANTYAGGTVISAGTLQIGDGGMTGSITGDVVNNGALVFKRQDAVTFAGVISGAGTFETTGGTGGTGVITLSGTNTYTGATTVSGGTLEVSGSLGNTAVTVNSGARLIGAGTIAGAVTIADGAHLAPGASGSTGVLSVGSLNLSAGSLLDFDLGPPNVLAGNDRVAVTGNLVLDGTLNMTDAGSFGGGVYRLFSYGGALTDNGLVLGAPPAGTLASDLSVQTAVAAEVNLVNRAGLALNFWDGGAAGNANNGLVDGGSGTWSAASGNWTDMAGSLNAPPGATPGFMIFQSAGGTVTVDQNAGAIAVTGIQFAADGYRIEGDPITLSGAQATIRVGDGSQGGAAYTATIASVLAGASDLVKTDFGTLVLAGANTYTGNTLLNAGTLSVSSDANLGDAAGGLVFNGGVLRVIGTSMTSTARTITWGADGGGFDIADAANSFTVGQGLVGAGKLGKLGAGTLVLTGANTYAGGTTISAGTLQIGDGGTTGSITGDVVDNGVLAFKRQDAVTFAGAISGTGALNQLGTGTLILTGANTYAGGTVISTGTLQIGDGGTSGSILGDVVNDGVLAFKRLDDVTFAGAISGTGALSQLGAGTLVLTGNNSYAGGTTIASGTLQLGDGGTTGSIAGDVVNNGALAFKRQDAVTFAGAISGTGALSQLGTGTLVLTGANTYAGGTVISAGTLQIGDGGTTGSITGDVVNNGALAFKRQDGVTFAGAISGSGALKQLGAGTLVLTGANTYAGGTVISAGTLQIGNGGTTGSITGDVVNNGALAFKRQDDVTFAGAVSGTGSLSQLGAGALVLTGNNSYAGGTTIASGTLQLGNGGTSGTIAGDVVNNGTLAFKRSDALTIAGNISGSGALKQIGGGTTTLGDGNSYAGGTTISAGTLRGSASSFGSGAILNNATLVIDQPVNAVFANTIDGSGSFVKDGAGSLNLTGSGSFSGTTSVLAGRLAVNGSFGNSPFTVQSGGILGGNGTIGGLTVNSGGTVAPGNSIGTLTVNGNVTLAPGSIYQVEVDGSGRSDMIVAKGAITVSGATLDLTSIDGTISPTARYELFSAAAGVSGRFDKVNSSFAFLAPNISYDAAQTYLTVARNEVSFGSVGETRNQTGAATASEQLGTGNAVYDAVVKLDAPGARTAFDALSGEVHASAQGVLVEESGAVRAAAVDRLRSAFGSVGAAQMPVMSYGFSADLAPAVTGPMPKLKPAERFAAWGQGYGSWGHSEAENGAAKLSRSTGGLVVGADVAVFDNLRFGALAGYSRTEFDAKGRVSSGTSDNYHLGLYGGGQWGALGLRAGASYSWHDVDTRRSVSFTGFGDSVRSDSNAGTAQVFGELGYRIDLGRVAIEPFAGLAYVDLHTDGFTEQGGAAALTAASGNTSVGYSTLGLRASSTVTVQGMDLTLRGALAWRHAFGDTTPLATLAFAGGNPFSVAGIPIAKNAALLETGIDLAISQNATLGLSYTGQLASQAQDHAFKGNLAVRF